MDRLARESAPPRTAASADYECASGGREGFAETVLAEFAVQEKILTELRQAYQDRLMFRFNLQYDRHFDCLLPHLRPCQRIVQTLQYTAAARLELGRTDEVLEDFRLAAFITRGMMAEPMLVSQKCAIPCHRRLLHAAYNGLASQRWPETQLAEMETLLAKFD